MSNVQAERTNPYTRLLFTPNFGCIYGRNDICQELRDYTPYPLSRSFALQGNRTIGKTRILNWLKERTAESQADFKCIILPARHLEGKQLLSQICESLFETFAGLDEEANGKTVTEAHLSTDPNFQDLQRLLSGKTCKVVVCIDDADYALTHMTEADESGLRSLTEHVSFVVVTQKPISILRERMDAESNYVTSPLSPFVNVLLQRHVGLLEHDAALDLLKEPWKCCGDKQRSDEPNLDLNDDEISFLISIAGRHPYLLLLAGQTYLNMVTSIEGSERRKYMAPEAKGRIQLKIEAQPEVESVFNLFWSRCSDEERHMLMKLASQQYVDEGEVRLPRERPIIKSLFQSSLIDQDVTTGRWSIFSEMFRSYVQSRAYVSRGAGSDVADGLAALDRSLFSYFVEHPNQLCSYDELQRAFWKDKGETEGKRGLDSSVRRIRIKLEDVYGTKHQFIQNVRGQGFRYVPLSDNS